jgi:hypothetical protein
MRVLQKGALIIESIRNRKDDDGIKYPLTLEFQFNPDSLKRTVKIVSMAEAPGQQSAAAGGGGGGAAGAAQASARYVDPRDLKSDSFLGETISITAYFDGKEKDFFKGDLSPVLSVIEKLMEPVELKPSQTNAPHTNPPKVLPLVFFWWGQRRIVPIKITQLTINETEFNPELLPIKAEVNMEMELLIKLPNGDRRIASAYDYTVRKRNESAQQYASKAAQASDKANYRIAVPEEAQQ